MMRREWFRGTCSNCRKKKQRVHKCGSVQVCKNCAIRFKTDINKLRTWGAAA